MDWTPERPGELLPESVFEDQGHRRLDFLDGAPVGLGFRLGWFLSVSLRGEAKTSNHSHIRGGNLQSFDISTRGGCIIKFDSCTRRSLAPFPIAQSSSVHASPMFGNLAERRIDGQVCQ